MQQIMFSMSGKDYILIRDGAKRFSAALTESENEILTLLLQGRSLVEISGLRDVSVNTISNQLSAIYRKTGVKSRYELIRKIHYESLSGAEHEVVS